MIFNTIFASNTENGVLISNEFNPRQSNCLIDLVSRQGIPFQALLIVRVFLVIDIIWYTR